MAKKFKVGDRVRVITKRHGAEQFGDVGTITSVWESGSLPFHVTFEMPAHAPLNSYAAKDLSLVTAPSVADDLKLKPQAKSVLLHLKKHGFISPAKAQVVYGITRLAACIYEIKKIGYAVKTSMKHDEAGHRYARYELAK